MLSILFTNMQKQFNGRRIVFSTNGARATGHPAQHPENHLHGHTFTRILIVGMKG